MPLHLTIRDYPGGVAALEDQRGERIVSGCFSSEVAQRILVCVNHCEGVPSELLALGMAKTQREHIANQHASLGRCADQISDLTSQRNELQAALEFVCRTALGQYTYDTWSLTATAHQRALMKKSLCAIAYARGKSTFGNDWQEALS